MISTEIVKLPYSSASSNTSIPISPMPTFKTSSTQALDGGGPNYALSSQEWTFLPPPTPSSPLASTAPGRLNFFEHRYYIRPLWHNNCKEMDFSSPSLMTTQFRPDFGASIPTAAVHVPMRNVGAPSPRQLMHKYMSTAVGANAAPVNQLMYCIETGRSVILC